MAAHAVVIVGGGPTGLMLAAELALAGVDAAIVERRASQELAGSRAGGLHARTIEILDQRGVGDRFVSVGKTFPVATFLIPLDLTDFPTRRPYTLGLTQNHIERILGEWVAELAVPIHRGREVTGFAQDDTGVDVELSDGGRLRAAYLVGCDGGRSLIRKQAGIDFPGWDATTSYLIAEASATEEPAWGMRRDERGTYGIGKLDEGGKRMRVLLGEAHVGKAGEPTLEELRAALTAVYGTDFGVHDATWISRFTDSTRQAAAYRDRRVFLAGDAAHVHSPVSGQGLNTGVHDAVNLGWKLAQVVKGTSPDSLLDSYHAERHPAGARVLRITMAQTALGRGDERSKALHELFSELALLDEPRRRLVGRISGLDVHYDLGAGHPLLGRRMPDLDLVTDGGPRRVFTLLHQARPLLIHLGDGAVDLGPWADRVRRIDARHTGVWELPVLGAVPAPAAVLIRPDGHVAWVGDGTDAGLRDALTRWFGPPR